MAHSNSNPVTKGVAIVTGASSGIGKAIVRKLLAEGWAVYGGARRVDQMQDIVRDGANVLPLDDGTDGRCRELRCDTKEPATGDILPVAG